MKLAERGGEAPLSKVKEICEFYGLHDLGDRSVSIALAITLILFGILPGTPLIRAALSDQPAPSLLSRSSVSLLAAAQLQSKPELTKGKFLVASRNLKDPTFFETVVLLIDYDRDGAVGLIINRPTKLKLSKVLPEMEGLQQRSDTVYLGGPVAKTQMSLLIRTDSQPEGAHRVFDNMYMASSRKVLQRLIDDAAEEERFRVYAGYAGWAPGQLDREVSRGGWHILPADAETVFDKEPLEIWPELIRRTSAQWVKFYLPVPALANSVQTAVNANREVVLDEGHADPGRRLY
jgi:putative transcriptional regulator